MVPHFHVGYADLQVLRERRFAYCGPPSMGDAAWRVFPTFPNAETALVLDWAGEHQWLVEEPCEFLS
jgi:hypothetical protein